MTVCFSLDNKFIASGSHDKSIKIRNVASKECVMTIEKTQDGGVSDIAWTPDGKYIASGSFINENSSDSPIKIWSVETGACIQEIVIPDKKTQNHW